MVAIVSGNGIGLLNTSGNTLGQNGIFGNAATGSSREGVYVNIANGNLTLQDKDDYIAARGVDLALTRTYNSQDAGAEGLGAQWKLGVRKQITAVTGIVNTAGSTLTRVDGDGTVQKYTYDAGRAAYVSTDGAGAYQTVVRDAGGNWVWQESHNDSLGLQEVYNGTTGRITAVKDEIGTRLSYEYDANGQVARILDNTGDVTSFTFANGLLTQVGTQTAGNGMSFVRTSYTYDAAGRLQTATVDLTPENKTDAKSYTTTYAYDGDSSRIANVTQSDGTSLSFTYVNNGGKWKVATVTDALARTTRYDYSVAGTTSVTDPLGNRSVYSYDAAGQLTQVAQAPVGGVSATTKFEYNAGNVVKITGPAGVTTAEYDGNGNQTAVRDAVGNVVTRTFDMAANLMLTETVTSKSGSISTTRYTYDAMHRVRFVVSGAGRVTEYRYDGYGDRTRAIEYPHALYPLGQLSAQAAIPEPALATWAANNSKNAAVTVYNYDSRSLLSSQQTYAATDASGNPAGRVAETLYSYDQAGQVLWRKDADENVTTFSYDGLGRILTTTVGDRTTVNTYDDANNTIRTSYANGLTTLSAFNAAGELFSVVQTGNGNLVLGQSRYAYDKDGRLAMVTDPDGLRTFSLYDEAGRKTATIDGDGSVTEYFYDTAGNLGRIRQYSKRIDTATLVDGNGNYLNKTLTTIRPQETAAESKLDRSAWNTYDALGRLVDSVDGEGHAVHRDYDGAQLVRTTEYARQLDLATLDAVNAPTSFAIVASPTEDRVTRSLYDTDGNLVGTLDPQGFLAERRYDAAGRLVELVQYQKETPSAKRAATGIADLRPETSESDIHERYLYDGRGRLVGIVDGAGYLTENVYKPSGSLAQKIVYGMKVTMTIGTDTTIDDLRATVVNGDKRWVSYEYTAQSQVEREVGSDGVVTRYTYDKAGKLASRTVALATDAQSGAQYRYDERGLIVAELDPAGVAKLAGLVNDADIQAVWNAQATRYTYDASGLRTSMTDPRGNRTLFYYDADGRAAYTIDALGDVAGVSYNAFGQVEATVQYATRIAPDSLKTLRGGLVDTTLNVLVTTLQSKGESRQTYVYDHVGQLVDRGDALGYHAITRFNGFGEVIGTFNPAAPNTTTVNTATDGYSRVFYDNDGRVAMTVNGAGSVTAYRYDGSGHVTDKIVYANAIALASIEQAGKDDVLKLVVADAAHDVHQQFIYDARGLLTTTLTAASPLGGILQWSRSTRGYDANGNLVSVNTYHNQVSANSPTQADIDKVARDASDQMVRYFYDGNNRLTATATALRGAADQSEWSIARRTYDKAGNVVAETRLSTVIKRSEPTANDIGGVPTTTSDQLTRYVYDSANRVIASAVAQGVENGTLAWSVTSFEYDTAGNLVAQKQLATKLGANRLPANPTETDFKMWILAGASAASSYDRTTRFDYDALNRLSATTDAAGTVTRREFDSYGNITVVTVADRTSRTVYDKNNRAVFSIDAAGGVTEYRYDARGNVVKTIAYDKPLQLGAGAAPTASDILAALGANALARTQRNVYDQANRLRFVIDAAGYVTENQYDGAGRISRSISWDYAPPVADGASVSAWSTALQLHTNRGNDYAYDAQGNVLSKTDTFQFFDAQGKLLSASKPADGTERYTYDGLGRRTSFTNKLDKTWSYEYDAAGRMVQETSPPVVAYANAAYNGGVWGDSHAQTNNAIVTRIAYDTFGNVASRTEAYGTSQARTTSYYYDDVGRQVKTVLPSTRVYDESADPKSSAGYAGWYEKDSGELSTVVTYDAFGDAVSNKDVGGNISEKAYDKLGRIVYERDALNYVTEYQRDGFGNVTLLVRHATPYAGSMAAGLDTLKQAIVANPEDRSVTTKYDALGRAVKTIEAAAYFYDPEVRLDGPVLARRTVDTEYDRYGEVIRRSVYGANDRGEKVTRDATVRYYYDVRGNKIAELSVYQEAGGGQGARAYLTEYSYDEEGNLTKLTEFSKDTTLYGDDRDKTGYIRPGKNSLDRTTSFYYDGLNRKTSEVRENVTYTDNAGKTVAGSTTTTFSYDALGNQVGVTDALGSTTFTRYDVLGRVTAIKKVQTTNIDGIKNERAPLTEFKLDVFGNVVLRIDYAAGAKNNLQGDFEAAATGGDDRTTATAYDNAGHAVQVVRGVGAENYATYTSYDAFGRAAKQWSIVADILNNIYTSYTITSYDKLGRLEKVIKPANLDLVDNTNTSGDQTTFINTYNMFGELTRRNLVDAAGKNSIVEQTSYDRAGNAWRSNSGDGVTKVTLFDVQGNATSVVRSAGTDANPLDALDSVAKVFSTNNLLRTDTSYDLLGHATGISKIRDLSVLRHDAATGNWAEVGTGFLPDDFVVVGRPEDASKTITVAYRLAGTSTWIAAGADRLLTINGYRVFSTAGLPGDSYDFQVMSQAPGEMAYESARGTIALSGNTSTAKDLGVLRLYAAILKRAPTRAELGQAMQRLNSGTLLPQLAQSLLDTAEAKAYLTGDAYAIMARIFADAFGRTGASVDENYSGELSAWTARFQAKIGPSGDNRGQTIVDLIAQMLSPVPTQVVYVAARTRMNNRVDAIAAYLIDSRGNDPTAAARLFAAADAATASYASIAPVVANAAATARREYLTTQVAQLYVTLLGRAPDPDAMFWIERQMANDASADDVVAAILGSAEATKVPELYPANGLTPAQYREQLVVHVYQNMNGRNPTPAELASWLQQLEGSGGMPAIGASQFILRLAESVSNYSGTDAALLRDQRQFNNRVAVALAIAGIKGTDGKQAQFDADVLRLVIGAVGDNANAQEAANAAIAVLTSAANFPAALVTAVDKVSVSTPAETSRFMLSRLYIALLNRAPDATGMAFYLSHVANTPEGWASIATALMTGAEGQADPTLVTVKSVNGVLVQRTNFEFVQRMYELALGQQPLPASVGINAEIAAFAQRLDSNTITRGQAAYEIVNGMLGFAGLSPSEQALKDKFDNKAAVGVAFAIDLHGDSQSVARNVVAKVTATDVKSALDYAYVNSQPGLVAALGGNGAAASQAASALDATIAALAGKTSAQTALTNANTAMNAVAKAGSLLSLVQIYVGLLGRTPDRVGLKTWFDNLSIYPPAQAAASIFQNNEAIALYPTSLTDEQFVAKVYATIFGSSSFVPADSTKWVQQLKAGTQRGVVWYNILTSVTSYVNTQPDAAGMKFLQGAQAFSARVATAVSWLDADAATQLATLQQDQVNLAAQQAQLQNGVNSANSTRDSAAQSASTQTASANKAGDGKGDRRLQITLLYASLLQTTTPPTLAELASWTDGSLSLPEIAQSIMMSTKAGTTYKNLDNTAFVKLLYKRILNRDVTAADNLTLWTDQLAQGMSRGDIAFYILKNQTAYVDAELAQLSSKAAFDKTIDTMLDTELAAANTDLAAKNSALSSAQSSVTTSKSLYDQAVIARQNANTAKSTAIANATDAHIFQQYASLQSTVTYIYMGLRGYTDISGVAFWMRTGQTDALITSLMPSGDNTTFVKGLYSKIFNRTPVASDLAFWVNNLNSGAATKLEVAKAILYSSEATSRLNPIVSSTMSTDTATVNALLSKETSAIATYDQAVKTETTKYNIWQANITTQQSASAAYTKANNVYLSVAAIASAHKAVTTADGKYVAAAQAVVDLNAIKTQIASKAAEQTSFQLYYNADHAASPDAQAIANLATASVNLGAAYTQDASLTTTARQARLVGQLYTALIGKSPALPAVKYWVDKLNGGASVADMVAALMNGPEAAAAKLYPTGMSNDAFVTQLFSLSTGRNIASDTYSLRFWSDKLSGSGAMTRPQLVAALIDSFGLSANTDSTAFNQRVAALLRDTSAAATALGSATTTQPSNVSLADYGAAYAALLADAPAAAAVPQAAAVTRAATLYVAVMDRAPDAAGLIFWANITNNYPALTDTDVAQAMLTSNEGIALYPTTMSTADFAAVVSGRVLGRTPTTAELGSYASMSRGAIVANILALAAAPATTLVQQQAAVILNGKVMAALAAAKADLASFAQKPEQALGIGKLAAATKPVDNHTAPTVLGVDADIQGGKLVVPTTRYTVDRWGNVLTMTDPRNANWVTTYTYNANNQLASTTTPFELMSGTSQVSKWASSSTAYDQLGRIVGMTDGMGFTNTYGYDSNGNVVTEKHADGGIVTSVYNLFGQRLSVQQPVNAQNLSIKTNYAYDHFGNLTSLWTDAGVVVYEIKNIAKPATPYNYGTPDLDGVSTGVRQLVNTYRYDALGRRITSTNAAGEQELLQYDLSGNVVARTDAMGNTTRTRYDALGHRNAEVDAMGMHKQVWVVDAVGRISKHLDYSSVAWGLGWHAPAIETRYQYDQAGRLVLQGEYDFDDSAASAGLANGAPVQHARLVDDGGIVTPDAPSSPDPVNNGGKNGRQMLTYTYVGEELRTITDTGTGQVTTYAYDQAGNRVREKIDFTATDGTVPVRTQDNTLTYDLQNRLSSVQDDLYTITYTYDQNGNRTNTHTKIKDGGEFDAFNSYDSMNRQLTVNYATRQDMGKNGHLLTYDLAGNRTSDSYIGTTLSYVAGSWRYSSTQGVTVERYSYDGVGRLETVTRDNMRIDTRYYDAAGRVLRSGVVYDAPQIADLNAYKSALKAAGIKSEYQIVAYDRNGHAIRQVTRDVDKGLRADVYLSKEDSTGTGGYDANGNLLGYTAIDMSHGQKIFYSIQYRYVNGIAQETGTTVQVEGGGRSATASEYDANGNRTVIRETDGSIRTRLWYDADGHVLAKRDKTGETFSLIVNGHVLGNEDKDQKNVLGTVYASLSGGGLQDSASVYLVQADGETLQTIAKTVWGDQNLWYLIADANGLSMTSVLPVGQTLRIPARASTVYNSAESFKPYSASEAIGDTMALPVPSKADGGCGGVGQLIMIVVAVVATIYTAGLASTLTFGSFTATMGAGVGALAGESIGAAAIGGALGSVASQAVGMAIGAQDSFNWRGVALSAVGAAATAGVGSMMGSAGTLSSAQVAGRAALSNVISQGVGIATGLQNGFEWRNVAASAAGAWAGAETSAYLSKNSAWTDLFGNNQLARSTASGFVAGTTTALTRGGKIEVGRIATDAFGNALGSSLAENTGGTPKAIDPFAGFDMDALIKNGKLTASLGRTPGSPIGSWSGDGEIMSDTDPNGRVYANEYEHQNRDNSSGLTPTPDITGDDLTMSRVVISGKQALEDMHKYDMRASMPDFGRTALGRMTPAQAPKIRLGNLSMKYETRMAPSEYRKAAGVVSSGKGDPGGISYGAYQLASNVGKVQDFLKNGGARWADQFVGMDPTVKGDFGKTWKAIAAVPTDDFFNAQHAYIEESNFDPVVQYLRKKTGLDVTAQPLAVQDAVWSASVQHGGARTFLRDAINSVQVDRSAPEYSEALLNAIYEKRIDYVNAVKKMDTATKSNLVNIRYPDELFRALQMLKK